MGTGDQNLVFWPTAWQRPVWFGETTGSNSAYPPVCPYCGTWHAGLCPRVREIEYHPNGAVKRVVLR